MKGKNSMKDFLFKTPTKIVFGVDSSLRINEILTELKVKSPFIITDKVIQNTDSFIHMIKTLEESGIACSIYSDTVTDPPIQVVDKAAKILKESGCDVAIAVGGGSPIDTAKAMCMLVNNEGSIKDYLFGGSKKVENPSLPLICVPTTAGSGSEVTASSVITDEENNIKLSVTHEYIIPKYAVIDPLMQKGMPPFITATTGMDALTHAIEAYVSLNANPISDAYAKEAIRLIGTYLRTAVFNPNDVESRSYMSLASVMAAVAFVNGGLGAVHGISQAMGGVAHVAHGVANAMILPYVMELNVKGNIKKFANIADLMGEKVEQLSLREQADKAVEAVDRLSLDLGIPRKLSEVNVTKEMFPDIVKGTMEYRLLPVNPVKIQESDVYEILEKVV